MSWCGYIDVLGTRSLANLGPDSLGSHLTLFHDALHLEFKFFQGGRCYAASDGAFFDVPYADGFYEYYRRVRNDLFAKSVFFKCSFIPGKIEVEIEGEASEERNTFFSLNFSGAAPKAVQVENQFNGIGCSIVPEKANAKNKTPSKTISNFYLKKKGSNYTAIEFLDFSFSKFEVSKKGEYESERLPSENRILHNVIKRTKIATMESEYIAAKYVPLLINSIRSSNFKDIKYKDGYWTCAPYILKLIVKEKSILSHLKGLPGQNLIILALFDKCFSSNNGELFKETRTALLEFIKRFPSCMSELIEVPEFVISAKNKEVLLKDIVSLDNFFDLDT